MTTGIDTRDLIEPIVDDFVERLKDKIPFLAASYPGTCKKLADPKIFLELGQVIAPFALVAYHGEVPEEPENLGAPPIIQVENMRIAVYLGAMSYSTSGEGTDNLHGQIGLSTLADRVWHALSGFLIPSFHRSGQGYARAYHAGTMPPEITDHRVVSMSLWALKVQRQGGVN